LTALLFNTETQQTRFTHGFLTGEEFDPVVARASVTPPSRLAAGS
jgi:hypothetical protein